jgi:hypothetical protein
MKIKPDENIGRRGVELLSLAGHDVMTVPDQGLQGARDETLFDVCAGEDRVMVILDHDFGRVLRFPPERSAGLVILGPGARVTPRSLLDRGARATGLKTPYPWAVRRSMRAAVQIADGGLLRREPSDCGDRRLLDIPLIG